MSRPIQGGDGERCGLRSAKWTSTRGPSTVQLYVADSARRCDPDEVAAGGFHEIRRIVSDSYAIRHEHPTSVEMDTDRSEELERSARRMLAVTR